MMRFFCMLGLFVLATPISHAGMVIDDFTNPVIGGGTRTASGFFRTPSTSGSFQVTKDTSTTLSYDSFSSNLDFLANNVISLADFVSDGSGTATLTVNGTTSRTQTFTSTSTGDINFSFGSGELSNVSSMVFDFKANPFLPAERRTFSFSSVQAVPEPTSIALVSLAGLGGLVARRRRKATQVAAI